MMLRQRTPAEIGNLSMVANQRNAQQLILAQLIPQRAKSEQSKEPVDHGV